MAQQADIFSLYGNFLKKFVYTFTYFPTTNWQRAFSPTINFGCNVEDAEVEQHVVDEVGSYGKQINRVLDAMTVLVSRIPPDKLTPQERRYVDAFEDLAHAADEASKKFKDKRRSGLTLDDINHTIENLCSLAGKDPGRYEYIVERIQKDLDRASKKSSHSGKKTSAEATAP
ncbi:MAG: hypothetical protein V9H25_07950 [Candidatus Competibacter sp.]